MTAAGALYRDLNAAGVRVTAIVRPWGEPTLMLIVDNPAGSMLFQERFADIEKHRDMLMILAIGQGVACG